MHRVRIALVAAAVVALVTGIVYWQVRSAVEGAAATRVQRDLLQAQEQIFRSSQLEAVDLAQLAATLARDDEFAAIFAKPTEKERQVAAGAACDGLNGRLEKQGRKAGIIGVIDAHGKLVARDLSYTWRYGDDLTKDYPSLAMALAGQPNKDVWELQESMYRVGAAAVRSREGQVQGAVFVGYVHSSRDASAEATRSGVDVGYFYEARPRGAAPVMKIQASSLKREGNAESSEEKELAEQIFGPSGLAAPAYEGHKKTDTFLVHISGAQWIAAAAPLPGNVDKSTTRSGFVVLANLSAAKAPAAPLGLLVLGLGLVGVLAAVGAAQMTSRRYLGPLDTIEAGVTEVINGNHDYIFSSPSPDFEGLANDLNAMIARLLGRPDPGEEDEDGGGGSEPQATSNWRGDSLFVAEASGVMDASAIVPENEALANEPADTYYQRIFREYVDARKQTGEGIAGIEADSFIARLKENEAALTTKYSARMVRFKVVVKNNQATLKPVPIT